MIEYIIFKIGPVVFALAGLILATYIFSTKKEKKKKLICPMGGHCDTVVGSQYSSFLGLPVELMGILYYGFIILAYGLPMIVPGIFGDTAMFFITFFTVGAFGFSVYLTFVQAFVLRNWCTWCLFSAGFSTLIFITAVFGAEFPLVEMLSKYQGVVSLFHGLSLAVGVGAATVVNVFFFKFLKDYRISQFEKSIMDTLSHVIWATLGILVITGIGLYIPQTEEFLLSSNFVIKAIAVFVVIVNSVFLHLVISPKLTEIQFGKKQSGGKHEHKPGELHYVRKLSFVLGAISITSWYSIFILDSVSISIISTRFGILIFLALLCFAVFASQVYDRALIRNRKKEMDSVQVIHLPKK